MAPLWMPVANTKNRAIAAKCVLKVAVGTNLLVEFGAVSRDLHTEQNLLYTGATKWLDHWWCSWGT